jgi:hypothetical protein
VSMLMQLWGWWGQIQVCLLRPWWYVISHWMQAL